MAFYESLAPRQKEVADYMALGYNNEKIAQEMRIHLKTVKNTINAIFRKLKPLNEEHPRANAVMLWQVYHQRRNR